MKQIDCLNRRTSLKRKVVFEQPPSVILGCSTLFYCSNIQLASNKLDTTTLR